MTLLAFARCATARPVAIRLLFRRGGLLAAASLSSVEAEELEPAAVLEDGAGCMGLVLGYPVCWFKRVMLFSRPDEQGKVLADGGNG